MSKLRIKKGGGLFSFLIMVGVFSLSQVFSTELAAGKTARTKELVYDFETMKNVTFDKRAADRISISLTSDCVSGGKAIELKYNFTSPEKKGEATSFQIKNLTSAGYLQDFTNYTKLSFYVKASPEAVENRDRIYVYFYSNVPGGKWVRYRAKVNENQEIDPELFCTTTEWKKITLDLKNGPFYKWNTAHPRYWKIFGTFKHDDFPWDKVFCIHVGVEKYDSGPHQGRVIFDHFQFLKEGDKSGNVKIPTSTEPLKPLALKTQKSVVTPKIPKKPSLLFIGHREHLYTGLSYFKKFLNELVGKGYNVNYQYLEESYYNYPGNVDISKFNKYNAIIYLGTPNWNFKTHQTTKSFKTQINALRKYVEGGGGVLVCPYVGPSQRPSVWDMMEPWGLKVLNATIHDRNSVVKTVMQIRFAYTTNIVNHPVTKGVKGVWYPVYPERGYVWNANTVPFKVDKNWQVLVKGAKTSYVIPYKFNYPEIDKRFSDKENTITSSPPLVAIREAGKGRIAFIGIQSHYHIFSGKAPCYEGIVMGRGIGEKKSDFQRLILNLFAWLSEPSFKSGKYGGASTNQESIALPKFEPPDPLSDARYNSFPTPKKGFPGIIGAQTVYSGGGSTPEEYISAAKKEGFKFIVFLEDLKKIDEDKFKSLQKECNKFTDENFVALPGIFYEDEVGNHYFAFKQELKIPPEELLIKDKGVFPTILKKPTGLTLNKFAQLNGSNRCIIGHYRVRKNEGVPFWDIRTYRNTISLFTYKNGKKIDEMVEEHLYLAHNGQLPRPVVLNFITNAEKVKEIHRNNQFYTVMLYHKLLDMRDKPGESNDFSPISYVTNGPRIEYWQWAGDRDYVANGNWYDWSRYRWKVRFKVSSENGLKEVKVMDGKILFRRFLPGGEKEFSQVIDLNHNQQHHLILIVEDNQGRMAISGELMDRNHLMELTYCTDRNNTLSYSATPSNGPFGSSIGTYPIPTIVKGPMIENLFLTINQDIYRFPGFDGQPGGHVGILPAPSVLAKNGSEGWSGLNREILWEIASADVAIQGAKMEYKFKPGIKVWNGYHNLGPLMKTEIFKGYQRYTTFVHPGRLPGVVLVDGYLEFLKDITLSEKRFLPVRIVNIRASRKEGNYRNCAILHTGEREYHFELDYVGDNEPASLTGKFDVGSYIYFYPSLFGPAGVFSLTDGLRFQYYRHIHGASIGFDLPGKKYRKGDKINYSYIAFTGPYYDKVSTELPERFRDILGIDGTVSYKVNIEQGKIISQQYVCVIDGKGEGFAGTFIPPKREKIPTVLPVIITNLNSRWSAVYYERDKKRYRPIGMLKDKAYAHIPPFTKPQKLFIGHPFTCDKKEIFITLVQTGKEKFILSLNNPTDRILNVNLKKSPFFNFIKFKSCKISIPAGEVKKIILNKMK